MNETLTFVESSYHVFRLTMGDSQYSSAFSSLDSSLEGSWQHCDERENVAHFTTYDQPICKCAAEYDAQLQEKDKIIARLEHDLEMANKKNAELQYEMLLERGTREFLVHKEENERRRATQFQKIFSRKTLETDAQNLSCPNEQN